MKTLHTIYTSFAKRALALIISVMAVTIAWGADKLAYNIVFSNSANGNTSISTSTQASTVIAEDSRTYVTASPFSNISKAYYGDTQTSIRLGTSSAQGELTIALSSEGEVAATKIVVSCGYWKSGESPTLSINGANPQTISSSEQDLIFDIDDDITSLVLNTTIRAYVYSISVYTEAAPSTFTVTYDANEATSGSVPEDNTKYASGALVTVLDNTGNLVKDGYDFDGWQIDKTGTVYTAGQTFNISSNVTLYAKWSEKSLTNYRTTCSNKPSVTLNPNGGTFASTPNGWTPDGNNYKQEDVTGSIDLPTPTRTGYDFDGWYDGETKVNQTYTPTETVTLVAKWIAIAYTITYDNLGEATNNANNPKTYTIESEDIIFEEPNERAGYIFKGWEPATIEKGSTGPVTVTAKWCELLGNATELAVDLNFINEENGQTYVKFSWTPADNTKSHATKQVICIGKVGEEKKCTDLEENQVWIADLRSKLTPGEYEWTIQAIGDGETYCDGEVISGLNFTIEEPLTDNCRWVEIPIEDITPEDEIVVTMGDDKTVYALGTETIDPSPKSQAITIASGMIDINQDFDYSKYTWSISAVTGGYQLQPYGTTQYLYGVASYITISSNPTTFSIFTSPENGNKCFRYTIEYTHYYLGHGIEDEQTAWKRFESSNTLKSNTLKFYKKICLPADEYWINYNLSNVTCTTDPIPSQIDQTGEDLLLEFSANDGYKLPESISVSIGNNILPEDNEVYIWDSETGELFINAAQVTDNITITIEGCEQLAAPENLLATNITSTSAVLSWDAVAKADEYIVFVTDGETNLEIPTTNCTITIEGLSKNTYYLWDVTATADNYCDSKKPSVLTNEFTTLDVYTVTFNTDGGTAIESQTVDHGSKATKPANPTKTGYTFAGWYTEADTEFNFNTPITSATTIYAKWNANKYTIRFLQQWGNGGTETATVHFNNNDFSVNPIIVPTRNGYTFGGYYTAESGAGTQLIDVSGAWLNAPTYIEGGKWVYADDLTLYAKWTQNFTITWMANGQPYHTQTAMMGTAIAKPDDPEANELACDDKVFVGWLDKTISGSTNEEPTFVTDFGTIQANKTYYAVFATVTGTPSNDYNQITDINDLTDGEYVIAYGYDTSSPSIILKAEAKDATKLAATSATPTNNKYTSPAAANIWEIKKNGDNYSIYNAATQKYVEATTTPSVGLSDNPEYYTISWNSSYSYWKIQIADFTNYWFVGYIQGETKYFQSYKVTNDKYRIQLYKNASTAVYSDYVTTCVEIPTPHWEGAEIDNANIAVDCGTISYKTNASTITFPTDKNYDLTYPITLTASEGFLLSTNKQNDVYEQSVTVTPVQSDDNKGKITQSVHVRADATGKNTNFDGTITISGYQLAEDQIIEVHAVVECPQYTLTFNDCGDTKTITDFAGTSVEEMESWAEICSEPVQYVFDGWAATAPVTNGTEEYEKVDFSTFTMPNNNTTTLYAVYRYAEEGGEPVNGYVKVTEALADWSGDYVIVDDEFNVAIQNTYEEDTKDYKTLKDVPVTIENDKIVSPTNDIIWTISKSGEYYTMYNTEAIKYAGITKNETRAAGLSETIATGYSMNIIFDSNTKIAKVSSTDYNRCFSYSESYPEWRTYSNNDAKGKTGYLYRFSNKTIRYTSSLVCGTIEAEDAIVTSTVGQTVKVYVPITLEYSDVASITGTSDNEAFTVVTKNDVAVGESTIEVHYKPTTYVNTPNQEETATITLTTSKGATTTFNVTGRCLPETFAIVAKVGNIWYALPSQGLNSGTTPVGYPVEVDNNDNPTAVTSLPTKAEWALRNVYKVNGQNDRFAANGENLVFVNAENKTLYASKDNANIQTYAEYSKYATTNPDRYEWVPTTTDLTNYTLKNVGRDKDLSINVNATFGTHASNIASNNLRFLPINATYNPFDMQVVEWYPTKVLVQTEAALTSVSATVGGVAVANPDVTKMGGKLYEISGLPLESNPTKILTISYDTYSCSKVIPIIISREDKTVENAPFSTLTKDIYNYSDLVVRDGAVLNITGAKNTPDKFVNVTIYPTAKIVVPENNQLSVYTLTFFGGIDDIYDGEKYTTNKYGVPQLSLKGTLGKTVTTMDYIMRVDLEQMYQMGVPYDVALADIKYWDGSAIEPGTQLYVSAYDGQARANRESKTWIWETDFEEKLGSATLKSGIGYTISAEPQVAGDTYSILRMPMKNNIASGNTEAEKSVNVVAYGNTKGVAITDNHKGWNYLSNPYMAAISGAEADSKLVVGYLRETGTGPWEWVDDTYRYVTIPHNDGEDYYQQKFSDATLLPFKSFFLQIETDGKLSFALASRQALPARLLQQENAPREVEFEILLANDTRSDNMGLLIGEDYTPAYEINADLEKMIGSMSVYTIYNGYNLAYNALSPINAQEQIPIGYVVPDVGEYTFKLDENADVENIEHIYLNDLDMNVITDLLEDEYTFYASEKKSEARFVINVIMCSEQEDDTPTRLEELDINTNHAIKFFYQDKLYILRNGIIYDAMGKQVQTINK